MTTDHEKPPPYQTPVDGRGEALRGNGVDSSGSHEGGQVAIDPKTGSICTECGHPAERENYDHGHGDVCKECGCLGF